MADRNDINFESDIEEGKRKVKVMKLNSRDFVVTEIMVLHEDENSTSKTVLEVKQELLQIIQPNVDPKHYDLVGVMNGSVTMNDDNDITDYDAFLNDTKAHLQFRKSS
ncbi:uncharacterized protein LOC106068488 isoform X2 [Biomphalaria glabrata]|nr:uncharacterized protein LOC106068488 isoform X2 [Biomphalaria glabrata]XP_055867235.1 uncharacterized protein LOC106068488 isoform X2 [Biomphalaria glabrata]XP_055867236.1 uncharacterized protein LOC106068488 isoform X2 [Biomphalaria glabrata]